MKYNGHQHHKFYAIGNIETLQQDSSCYVRQLKWQWISWLMIRCWVFYICDYDLDRNYDHANELS